MAIFDKSCLYERIYAWICTNENCDREQTGILEQKSALFQPQLNGYIIYNIFGILLISKFTFI